ncbi:Uncharacterized protein Rs2_18407 [Raphanus sativus]|nr:Uncharacterized protein Rs2_18407 [Raphanus sativus]
MAENTFPPLVELGSTSVGDRRTAPVIDAKPLRVSREEAESYCLGACGSEGSPPEAWIPVRPRDGQVAVGPSRSTYPFLNTVRGFCKVPGDVVFRLPQEGERADASPQGWFTLFED